MPPIPINSNKVELIDWSSELICPSFYYVPAFIIAPYPESRADRKSGFYRAPHKREHSETPPCACERDIRHQRS